MDDVTMAEANAAVEDALDLEGIGDAEEEEGSQDPEPEPGEASEEDPEEPAAEPEEPEPVDVEKLKRAEAGLRAELVRTRQRSQEAEARLAKLTEALSKQYDAEQASKAQAELPDKDEDPAGYLAALIEAKSAKDEAIREEARKSKEAEDANRAYLQAAEAVSLEEQRFAKDSPDYYDALNFARDMRRRMISASHPELGEHELNALIAYGDQQAAMECIGRGESPAVWAYETAKRMGYTPSETPPEASTEKQAGEPTKPAARKMRSLSAVAGGSKGGRKLTKEEYGQLLDAVDPLDPATQDPMITRILEDDHLSRRLELDGSITI